MTTQHSTTTAGPPPGSTFWQRFRTLGSLRRSSDHRAVAGVADGLSRHFDLDPIIVRVLFVALIFFGGAGVVLYVALWLFVPEDNARDSIVSRRFRRDPEALITAGLALGGIGAAVVFLGSLSWVVPRPFPFLVLLALVALGAVGLTRRGDQRSTYPTAQPAAPAPTAPMATAAPESTTTVIDDPARAWWQRDDVPPAGPMAPPVPAPPAPPKRPKSHLFGLTMATIALAIAALWIVDGTTSLDPDPSVYPGTALGIIAIALLVSTRWGRSRGLIVMGVLASLLTAGAAFAGPGPYGDIVHAPTRAAGVQSSYHIGGGQLTLRLEDVADIQNLQGKITSLNARFGRVLVVIPSTVAANVDATVDHGQIDGVSGARDLDNGGEHVVLRPASDGRPTMTVNIHLRFGQIQIDRVACPGAGLPSIGESTTLWWGDTHVAAACN